MIELKKIREIIKLIQDTDVAEIEVWDKDDKVRIRRGSMASEGAAHSAEAVRVVAAPAAPGAAPASPAPSSAKKLHAVPSPFVGTFYRSPSPDRDPFVEVGSKVKKGQSLCIVEAMKLMNEIECEVSGTVVEILVESGHPVEYGQALFQIEAS